MDSQHSTIIYMFHAGKIPEHTRFALELLLSNTPSLFDGRARLVFAGTERVPNPKSIDYDFIDLNVSLPKSKEHKSIIERRYEHHSPNSMEWEINAMLRWLVLDRYLTDNNYQGNVLFLDSDIFLYSDIIDILGRFSGIMGFGEDCNPGISFFRDASMVKRLCEMMISIFSDDHVYGDVVSTLGNRIMSWGGSVQEMGVIFYFVGKMRSQGYLIDSTTTFLHEGFYDYSVLLQQPTGPKMLMDDYGKVIAFRGNNPYCIIEGTSQLIRMYALHIHGSSKQFIRKYIPPSL